MQYGTKSPERSKIRVAWRRHPSWPRRWTRQAGTLLALLLYLPAAVSAEPSLVDNFTRDKFALQLAVQTGSVRLLEQGFDTRRARQGLQAERVVLACPAGEVATIAYNLPRAPAIDELQLTVWTMCNRPGVRLAARVVLPRSINPATAMPYTIAVRGNITGPPGTWQQLRLGQLPRLIALQARVARAQYHAAIDERGAFVDQILLIVPGGNGPTELLVDRVEVNGVLQPADHSKAAGQRAGVPGTPAARSGDQAANRAGGQAGRPGSTHANTPAPLVPRIIEWQGEPFEYLASLGFDAVALKRTASSKELAEARRLGLFLVCPPPPAREIGERKIGEEYSPVLAWDLGQLLSTADISVAARWQVLLKRHDSVDNRPSMIVPSVYPREASRIADIVLLGRDLLGSHLSLRDYTTWLHQQKQLVRPGTRAWSQIETQLEPAAATQLAMQHASGQLGAIAPPSLLTAQIALAATIKSQGFYFTSHRSLAANDLATRRRAITLELINLQLGLIEPWLASGKLVASARSTDPRLTAAVLQVERSYLMVPIRWSTGDQPSAQPKSSEAVSLIVPGVPESCEVYFLSPAGTERLRHRRVTGGVRIFFDSSMPDGFVLLTEDGYAFSQVASYLRQHGLRTAQLYRDLAAARLQQVAQLVGATQSVGIRPDPLRPFLDSANRQIAQCDAFLQRSDVATAYRYAAATNAMLEKLEQTLANPIDSRPNAAATLASAPVARAVAAGHSPVGGAKQPHGMPSPLRVGPNRLAGAGFENLSAMIEAGWRHQFLPAGGVVTAVRLSPMAPHGGTFCLELEAKSTQKDQPPGSAGVLPVLTTAPVWVVSAPVPVRAGERLEISGMVRVPELLLGSVDGLLIFDSLGGQSLALRFGQTPSWKPFRIVRTVPADTEVTVTFALAGLGTAQIDDIAVRTIESPATARKKTAPTQTVGPRR